jgi:hypothetical protein
VRFARNCIENLRVKLTHPNLFFGDAQHSNGQKPKGISIYDLIGKKFYFIRQQQERFFY